MEMGDFLSKTVIYGQLVVVRYAQSFGNELGGFEAGLKGFGRSMLKVRMFFFGNDKQVNRRFWAMVGDDDNLIGLVKDFGRRLAPDDAGKDGRHGGKDTVRRFENNRSFEPICPPCQLRELGLN